MKDFEIDAAAIKAYREREKMLLPLRNNNNTVIYVKPEKRTEEYAEAYRKRCIDHLCQS